VIVKKVEANLNMLSLAASETTTIIIANSQGKQFELTMPI
jgi:hypothetical protein